MCFFFLTTFLEIAAYIKFVIEKKTPYLDNDAIMKCPKALRIELGNNDFRYQLAQISTNSYVAKNQTKMAVDFRCWTPVYLPKLPLLFQSPGQPPSFGTKALEVLPIKKPTEPF